MDRQFLRYLQITFKILDLLILNLIVNVASVIFIDHFPNKPEPSYFPFLIFMNLSWIILSWLTRIYREASISSFEGFFRRTHSLYLLWLCSVMMYLFFFSELNSRYFIITSIAVFLPGLYFNRFLYIIVRQLAKNKHNLTKRILIVGYNEVGKKLMYKLESGMNNKIIGFIEEPHLVTELTPYPVLGALDQTMTISQKLNVNQIFSTVGPEQNNNIYGLMQEAEAQFIRFRIIPDLSFFIKMPVHVEFFEGMPMVALRREPLEDTGNRIKKRAMDIVISSFVVIFILSWLIPLLSILIYLESRGPVFFSQWRSGRNNKPFRCLKFRSMRVNNHGDVQATKSDIRLTRVGRIIRKTSLDEFPQFINVLKGEMSLVGPRPHMLKQTEEFTQIVDQYMIRQFLQPGITGWAQINGFRGEIKGNEQIIARVECDLWYSENWNTWLDFKILFLTVYKVFKGDKNAY